MTYYPVATMLCSAGVTIMKAVRFNDGSHSKFSVVPLLWIFAGIFLLIMGARYLIAVLKQYLWDTPEK